MVAWRRSPFRSLVLLPALLLSACTSLLGDFTGASGVDDAAVDSGSTSSTDSGTLDAPASKDASRDSTPTNSPDATTSSDGSADDGSTLADASPSDATSLTDAIPGDATPGTDSASPTDANSANDGSSPSDAAPAFDGCYPTNTERCPTGTSFLQSCNSAGSWTDAGPCPSPTAGSGTGACQGNVCGYSCAAPTSTVCNTGCVNSATDKFNCGGCGFDCTKLPNVGDAAAVARVSGVCTVSSACAPGFAHCTSDASAGCETPISTTSHCGACGTSCSSPTPLCTSDDAGAFVCAAGCSGATPALCGTSCSNPLTDQANCGTCGNACGPTLTCLDGGCGGGCAPSQVGCGADNTPWACVGGARSPTTACGTVATCSDGGCVPSCELGLSKCVSMAAAAVTEVCAASGASFAWEDAGACPGPLAGLGYATCNDAGTGCGSFACVGAAGYSLCGNSCVLLASDDLNCGTCNTQCDPTQGCSDGGCTGTCRPGTSGCSADLSQSWACNSEATQVPTPCGAGTCIDNGTSAACYGSCFIGASQCVITDGGATTEVCDQVGSTTFRWEPLTTCTGPADGGSGVGEGACNGTGTACGGFACSTGSHACPAAGTCALNSDPNACGSNCSTCPPPATGTTTGSAACLDGGCGAACNTGAGYSPCGTSCIQLGTNFNNCGACGKVCSSTQSCVDGGCTGSCAVGQVGCNGNTPWACQSGNIVAGTACSSSQTCSDGGCYGGCEVNTRACLTTPLMAEVCVEVSPTSYAWEDAGLCPGPSSGSGSAGCLDGGCVLECTGSSSPCGSSCVQLQIDHANCGACGAPCDAGTWCSGGVCSGVCGPGEIGCSGNTPWTCADGGEVLAASPCTASTCVNGSCVPSCQSGTNQCGGSPLSAEQCELQSSGYYAWVSTTACPVPSTSGSGAGVATCDAGVCGPFQCNAASHECGSLCASNTDVNFCGSSCEVCPAPTGTIPLCVDGGCSAECNTAAGYALCSAGCTLVASDPLNCGSCGYSCLGGTCAGGVCQSFVVESATSVAYLVGNDAGVAWEVTTAGTSQTHTIWSSPVVPNATPVSLVALTGALITPGFLGLATSAGETVGYLYSVRTPNVSGGIRPELITYTVTYYIGAAMMNEAGSGAPTGCQWTGSVVSQLAVSPDGTMAAVAEGPGQPFATCSPLSSTGAVVPTSGIPALLAGSAAIDSANEVFESSPSEIYKTVGATTAAFVADAGSSDLVVANGTLYWWGPSGIWASSTAVAQPELLWTLAQLPTAVLIGNGEGASGQMGLASDGRYLYYSAAVPDAGPIGVVYAPVTGKGSAQFIPGVVNPLAPAQVAVSGPFVVWYDSTAGTINAIRAPH